MNNKNVTFPADFVRNHLSNTPVKDISDFTFNLSGSFKGWG